MDIAIAQLNKTLKEVYTWCLTNRLTPHPGKSEVMLLSKGTPMGPHAPIQLGTPILRMRYKNAPARYDCRSKSKLGTSGT